ncbi:hypothetical protein GSI_07966 [Ganoderma sinense ZZ0214-1]|uniref:Uncharacterized protein n=1 Tax=Ganoderma sinense ZZ0214-1 TaxID=1077348 RepID=A0A2G8S7M3_9APHY|nr:hypothetical protein GSI_07966 [Ganoderma sinense ZZ0214-1]
MKDPTLEARLTAIERAEKKRRSTAARLLNKKKKKQSSSRKAVILRMIQGCKHNNAQQKREQSRPTFGTQPKCGALLHPEPLTDYPLTESSG